MTGPRHYPPALLIHAPTCPERPRHTEPMPSRDIARQHPNAVPHNCYHPTRDRHGAAEAVVYPPHQYRESTIVYDDAVKALCRVCRGTHEFSAATAGLILPANTQRHGPASRIATGPAVTGRLILPGNVRPGEPPAHRQRNLRLR